ncbi:FAD-dependent oxidoreductase [Thermomonas fusca]|uniref:Pyridine nucleotide-disulfide oxidoreductase n=1 Tax=Thermomonas fusca TaxID=215690 RepID=A0A5R9PGM5_9GAMM|nr:FAD-dependent oxidoreductase [Thermomonas fusca]TLX22681.1 pyridine nucleotide-disulfide oxidoreductase [Thermomonas fusca]
MAQAAVLSGPDFTAGVALASIPAGGVLLGHVGDTPVLLALVDGEPHAVSASCTHYGGPLDEGLRVGDEIRCPWHHACFSLRSGKAVRAPAFAPLDCWKVEVVGERVFVRGEKVAAEAEPAPVASSLQDVLIIGGGAAGFACAQRLRERGFGGRISMLSEDSAPPVDRPNLSKDYLAGSAPAEWIPLQTPDFYREHGIDLHLDCVVTALDLRERRVTNAAGERFGYDALLLATGAEASRIPLPRFDLPNVFTLRTLADADALLRGIADAHAIAVIGSGFIGMEAASALRARGLAVHVVTPEALPLERILGAQLAQHLLGLHQSHGVQFHLQTQAEHFDGSHLRLASGDTLPVDALLVGIGVRPRIQLADAAGLRIQNGIVVDDRLRTAVAGVYAAGDVARYPHGGGMARVEHWVHAQRQGQCVADNMLGLDRAFNDPPFFWTHHYGIDLRHLGHGTGWNRVEVDGDPAANDCLARYYRDDVLVAAAAIGRDRALLALQAQL